MNAELSICIPTLNRANFIGETLDSIVSQLDPGMEIVIVDGGSTDGTKGIVESYVARFPQIRYVLAGQAAQASNAGFDRDCSYAVQLANGTHCWLMTDDDVLKPGAVARVLAAVREAHDLVIVSCEVRDLELREQLMRSRPGLSQDRVFVAGEWDDFFRKVIAHVTFVGAVVVRRSLWLERNPEDYFGSGFVHVGVLFRKPIEGTAIILAEPLVVIRNGNGQWNARAFDIFMLRWPQLVWSFEGISDGAKRVATPREPWRLLRVLLLQRAYGRYSMREYELMRDRFGSAWKRLLARNIARLPLGLLYWPARLYGHFRHEDPRFFIETLDEAMRAADARRHTSF
ncbi:glycosyltransferase family 2 protein [Rhodanobacter hydrolyticus]|uniref:Glycosyltransferase family 2 protein n=1 Tax=Rhodanobacter hydrolyticus TaxID=2250595 RepID=A0ABW8JBY4_9GAMM